MHIIRKTLIVCLFLLLISGCGAPGKGEKFKVGDPDAPPPNKQEEKVIYLIFNNRVQFFIKDCVFYFGLKTVK
ncbi:hypothetical protein [Fictibacillus barbaricus]|uniref:Lipoprotein n=1 Tax=Fictibacillus barbaricus TaxID=182136 RepID=A0ABS2ZJD4_9BACL|nr:hypothetical protein [Fictibacillus barbaricus]MBN3546815.1 hypothetical protein [Fictibacillus barbaricus]GGB44022.1 hypothetical protein GCM10007199_06740 [Fictibacillus barbaricus]